MRTNKVCFIMYYSPTRFVRFCDLHRVVEQEYKQSQKLSG